MKVSDFLKLSPGERSAFVAREILQVPYCVPKYFSGSRVMLADKSNPEEGDYTIVFDADTPDAMIRTVERLQNMDDIYVHVHFPYKGYSFVEIMDFRDDRDKIYTIGTDEYDNISIYIAVHIAAGLALGVLEEG